MAENTQDSLLPSPRLPVSGEVLEGFTAHKAALALGMVGAGAAVLFICAHWSIAVVGAAVILVLSAIESEPFLLFIFFLIPLGGMLNMEGGRYDVLSAVRSLVIVGFFLSRIWRGRVGLRWLLRPSLARASLYLLGAIIVSIIFVRGGWTHDSARSLYKMGSYVGFFFLVLAWADSPGRVQKVLRVLLYSTIATAVFAILQEIVGGYTSFWLYLNPPGDYFVGWDGRATSFLNYPNSLAGYLNLVLPFSLACSVLGQGKWKRLGGWTLGLGFLALLSTQSVGGLLGFVAILLLAIFYFTRNRRRRLVLLACACALVCLLYLLRNTLNPIHSDRAFGTDLVSRLLLWQTAWSYFIHFPVMGVGWGNFVGLYGSDLYSYSSFIPPGQFEVHNIYLQFLAETGLVGFFAFFHLIVQSWRQAQRQFRYSVHFLDRALAFGVLGALVSVLAHGFVDFLMQVSQQFGTLFWVLLALLVASARIPCEAFAARGGVAGAWA